MPLLFYGTLPGDEHRKLYAGNMREIETSVFDSYMVKHLAPYIDLDSNCNPWAVANFWHFTNRKHCAIAWHDEHKGREQVVWLPSLLEQIDALTVAREAFGQVIPSSIIFRFNNEDEVYEYI